jgi:hypothetical protein
MSLRVTFDEGRSRSKISIFREANCTSIPKQSRRITILAKGREQRIARFITKSKNAIVPWLCDIPEMFHVIKVLLVSLSVTRIVILFFSFGIQLQFAPSKR